MSDNYITHHIPKGHTPAVIIVVRTATGRTHSKDEELIEYEYKEKVKGFVDDGVTSQQARRASIRAFKDGETKKIFVAKGQVIEDESAPLMEYEGCDHDTRFNGVCANCGKSISGDSESHVNMTHDATSLSVSLTEAKRLEKATVQRLAEQGKLSLIVDLDQTLIHATVGTAIDEWVNSQGEMPKDIRMFPLPDSPTPYYIKLRPHLERFLKDMSDAYELHIYTMGTRNYAAAVANVIDPEGKFFSQRILSRDENSHMTQKSIQRLFPCDDSMVVVIDDRADVWRNSPNLVKVHPYEYFVGTGDINAGHLPKLDTEGQASSTSVTTPASTKPTDLSALPESTGSGSPEEPSSATPSPSSTLEPSNVDGITTNVATSTTTTSDNPLAPHITPPKPDSSTDSVSKSSKVKAPVLDDKDDELQRVSDILLRVHERYFDALENRAIGAGREAPNVKVIISNMKSEVLRRTNIVFSSVIPLGQRPESADIWRQARTFGANCFTKLSSRITHVVAAKPGTAKVMSARRRKNIRIVRPEWLYDSIAKWQKQDESKYLLLDEAGKSTLTSTTPPPLAEDLEDDGVEDEEDDQGGISEGMDENHRPLSIDKAMMNEHLNSMNWDDLEKEIADELGEDLDDSEFDSDTSNTQSDASTGSDRSPLISLKRARIPRKSGLGASVTYGSSDDEEDGDKPLAHGRSNMDGIQQTNDSRRSDESEGDIDEENGSDGDDDTQDGSSEVASESGRLAKGAKRRRLSKESGQAADEDDVDADDEITMDHSVSQERRTDDGSGDGDEGEDDEEEDEDEDDDAFLFDMENDLEAQLNED
ncbi:Carboxy-terminal domain (CTD) phosphatase [Mortierella claussenii]|nr:Carboxy-terminal domain (CTD) phosphatase [Mortierella claussenii]